jgi:hypothetical protein
MVSPLLLLLFAQDDPREQLAPALVAEAHREVGGQCDACHLPFAGVPDAKCLRCHSIISELAEDPESYHARVADRACIDCHTDHLGRAGELVEKAALDAFDHSLTRWALTGKHGEGVPCARCHELPLENVEKRCGSCHQDPHGGSLGGTCENCHVDEGWKERLKIAVDHRLDMSGGHATTACTDCHFDGRNLEQKVACASCHPDPHGGTKKRCDACHSVQTFGNATFNHGMCGCKFPGAHQTASCLSCHQSFVFTPTPKLCSTCHEKQQTHQPIGECSQCHLPTSWKARAFDHDRESTFPITGRHLEVSCDQCHETKVDFRAAPDTCTGCHFEDGRKVHGDFGECSDCHSTAGFRGSRFDHASTGFRLDGAHDVVTCKSCHLDREADRDCATCHQDPHDTEEACVSCHSTSAWKPSTFDLFRHASTAFPLAESHREVPCASCHVTPRTMKPPTECARCHLDAHAGRLGSDCKRCHATDRFDPASRFDHGETALPLRGKHAAIDCARCHRIERTAASPPPSTECKACHLTGHGAIGDRCDDCHRDQDRSFVFARGRSRFDHEGTRFPLERRHRAIACKSCHPKEGPDPVPVCAVCHVDPHSGQMGRQCEDCHREDNFRLARFDHDQTSFPLRGRHFSTPCARCHTNQRWVGLTDDCFDCHALDAARSFSKNGFHFFGRRPCGNCHLEGWGWP